MNILLLLYTFLTFTYAPSPAKVGSNLYVTQNGSVHFVSKANLETIKASSQLLKGVIDADTRKFAFSLQMQSFEGFNSPLQRTHFNENYLETRIFPTAQFEGKIIDNISLEKDGTFQVKAVGKFVVHGITQEKIIPATIIKKGKSLIISSTLSLLLSDFNIAIPKIVELKIAKSVEVTVSATLHSKS